MSTIDFKVNETVIYQITIFILMFCIFMTRHWDVLLSRTCHMTPKNQRKSEIWKKNRETLDENDVEAL